MTDGKVTRAELAEAVRELREEVTRLRAECTAHACHGHSLCCSHVHCNWGHWGCFIVHSNYAPLAGGTAGCPVLGYEMSGDTVVRSGYTASASN